MIRVFVVIFSQFVFTFAQGNIESRKIDYDIYLEQTIKLLQRYPESTLIDIYKYFFQGRFGPEHLISDSLLTLNFLKDELKSEEIQNYKKNQTRLIEILLPEKKFVRVDLSLIKDQILPLNLFFSAFLESSIKHDSSDYFEWKKDWTAIVEKLEANNLKIKNFREDKTKIQNAFRINKFVFSHSESYKKNYKPHYRIIDYKIFQRFLLPYVKQFRIKFEEE